MKSRAVSLAAGLVLWASGTARAYDLVVAQDGSGDYLTVQAAIDAVPKRRPGRTTIFIRAGTYFEKITIPTFKPRLTLVGEDRDTTVITSADYTLVRGVDPLDTLTCYVQGKDFGAQNLTFANTAGDVGEASFALWIEGDRAHFRNCAILGYQDTMYAAGREAYFKRCRIEGAVDFIFGPSTAVFKACAIHCLDSGYITAADTGEAQPYGFVFMGCTISSEAPPGTVYLGRAYGDDARVTYLGCDMDAGIAPAGWDDFGEESRQGTASFAEYRSTGAGADPAGRVDWSFQLTAPEAGDYTLAKIFHLLTKAAPWYSAY